MCSDWNMNVKRRVCSLPQFCIEIVSFNPLQEFRMMMARKMRDLFEEK